VLILNKLIKRNTWTQSISKHQNITSFRLWVNFWTQLFRIRTFRCTIGWIQPLPKFLSSNIDFGFDFY